MPSSYTPNLRLTNQATGENLNVWGTILNDGTISLIDSAIAGRAEITLSGPTTLTSLNGAPDQARQAWIDIVGGTGGTITIPAVNKLYLVRNASTGNATFTTGSGASAIIAANSTIMVACDGTNVRLALPTDFQGSKLTGIAAGVASTDAINKAQGDAILASANAYANSLSFSSGNLPSVSGNAGKYLTNDGSTPSWQTLTGTFSININGNSAGTHTGPVVGNVTGNVTGSSGSCTGNAATSTYSTTSGTANSAATASTAVVAQTAVTQPLGTNDTTIATTAFATRLVPPGSLIQFASPTAPSGWLECDGSTISRTTYAALFAAIGTTWGAGDGSTTFVIPDFRGEFVRGWDHGKGTDPLRTFASFQADDFKSHTHGYTVPQRSGTAGGTGTVGGGALIANNPYTTDPAGGTETRPRNYAVLWVIKT